MASDIAGIITLSAEDFGQLERNMTAPSLRQWLTEPRICTPPSSSGLGANRTLIRKYHNG